MRLVKLFSVYAIGSFLTQAINFLLIPVFTNYLTPKDYGILSLLTTIISFIAPFVSLSIDGAISVEYYKQTFNDLKAYVTSSLYLSFLSFTLFFLIFYIFRTKLESFFAIPRLFIILVPLICFMEIVRLINLLFYQMKKEAVFYAIYSLINVVAIIGIALIFIVGFNYNFTGRLYAQYLVGAAYFFTGIYLLKKHNLLGLSIKKSMVKDAFHYGIPLVPHAIGFIIINLADRLFISHYLGNEKLGIYSLAYTIGSVILLMAQAFNSAWIPNLLELLKENTAESKSKVVSITYKFLLILLGLTILLIALSPLIFKYFINQKFYEGLYIVPWIAFSSFFFGCYLAFTNFIFYLKANRIFAYVSIINMLLNLGLNFWFIRVYGIYGAAFATFISFFVFAAIIIFISAKLYPMPWLKQNTVKQNGVS